MFYKKAIQKLGFCALSALSSIAYAAETVGELVNVLGSVNIIREEKTLTGKIGFEVQIKDIIETGKNSATKISFKNETHLVLFPDSKIFIEDHLKKSQEKTTESKYNITKGKVKFSVKTTPQQTTSFHTPNAVMGIRGTSGVINIIDHETTHLVVSSGQVQLAEKSNLQKFVLVNARQISSISKSAGPTPPKDVPQKLVDQVEQDPFQLEVASPPPK